MTPCTRPAPRSRKAFCRAGAWRCCAQARRSRRSAPTTTTRRPASRSFARRSPGPRPNRHQCRRGRLDRGRQDPGEGHLRLRLRDIVVFPHVIAPLFVGRKKSILALEEAMRSDTFILLATQKNVSDDNPATEAIYEIGTLASVPQLLKLPDGTVKVLVEGAQRAKVVKYTDCSEYYEAEAVALGDTMGERVEAKALARAVSNDFESYAKLNKRVPPEVVGIVQQIEDYAELADTVASHLALKLPDRQAILETTAVTERLEKVLGLMDSEISVLQVEKRIRTRVKRQMEKTQREFFLHEQMRAIQKELGDEEGREF